MDSVREKVQNAFREVFDSPELVLRDEMTPEDVEAWDSMGLINLVVALEEGFGIKFTTTEIPEMQSVGAILGLIREKVGQ